MEQVLDTEPTSGHRCYMCAQPATVLIHDGRGCRPACPAHQTWRMHRSVVSGHEPECYKSETLSTNSPVR